METQPELNISEPIDSVETYKFEPILGQPMLQWTGKRPFESTQFYPAQLKETHGEEVNGWRNKIYWGDNLQVMSHLLKIYRGKIDLIYIDPPFDSKADYKMQIKLRGKKVNNDHTAFEEKQYTDIWTNDEYLQFMYERLILMRELLADCGSIYVHCDWRMNSYIRLAMDEIFGRGNFLNQISWYYRRWNISGKMFAANHDNIFYYAKNKGRHCFNQLYIPKSPKSSSPETSWRSEIGDDGIRRSIMTDEPTKGVPMPDMWEISMINPVGKERIGYPTQKPEALLERIIKASSNPGNIVFDCFMGSGTTQSVAMKLGRRFIGADINLGVVETAKQRLLKVAVDVPENGGQEELHIQEEDTEKLQTFYTGLEVYNVNNYEVFRNALQAKDLLIEALEIQPLQSGGIYDGEKDGRMVKIMPINRIATRAGLNELIAGFDYHVFEKRQEENPTLPVEKLLLVCMGHEPGLKARLENEVLYKLDIEVVDILRDKSKLEFKRESKAKIVRRNGHLIIEQFYPMNLLQKLSLMEENVEDWRELVESVKIDFDYDGEVLNPSEVDIPDEGEMVKGSYPIPEGAGTIQVKITDLLTESLEETLE